MAYTTEEQDFQSFLSKFRQALPTIITVIATVVIVYVVFNWYTTYQKDKVTKQYIEFSQIAQQTSDLDVRAEQIEQFITDNPDSPLATIGVLNTVKQFVDAGKYDQALTLINYIPADNTFNTEIVAIDKAKILLQLGRGEEGIRDLDTVKEGVWYVNARVLAGDIYYSLSKYELSLAEYLKARTYLETQIKVNQQKIVDIEKNTKNVTEETQYRNDIDSFESQIRWVQSRMNIIQSLIKNQSK